MRTQRAALGGLGLAPPWVSRGPGPASASATCSCPSPWAGPSRPPLPWATQAWEHPPAREDPFLTVGVGSPECREAVTLAGDFPAGRGLAARTGSWGKKRAFSQSRGGWQSREVRRVSLSIRDFSVASLARTFAFGSRWNQRKKGLSPWLAGAHYSLFHGLWFNACLTGFFFFSSWLLISFCQLYILMHVFMEIFIAHMLHIKHHHKAFLLQSCWNKWCYYYNNFIGLYLFCNEKDLWLLEPSTQAAFTAFCSCSDLMELLKLLKYSISQLSWAYKAERADRRNRAFACCHTARLIPGREANTAFILHTMAMLYFTVQHQKPY